LSFHQDLNGDGVIGIPGTIESAGSTSLVQVGNNYFLDSNSTGIGPEVMFGGAPLTAGEFAWTPTGAEQTSTGYEIALKYATIGQYTVWNTDTNGNVTYDPLGGGVPGTSAALEALEPSFHQDLNGDGVIGIPAATSAGASVVFASAAVTVANKDTFVFGPAMGAAAIDGSANVVGYDALPAASANPPAEFSHDAASFQWANDGHGSMLDHGSAHTHWLDAHASGFMIH